ncbi:unnamed protein product, partial [Medioppia subpectinata]
VHELWDAETFDYDYCVLTLETDIVQSPTVQTVELATSAPTQGTTAQLTGWGKTSGTSSTLPYLLQYTIMDIVSWEVCKNLWEPAGHMLTDRMICASHPTASGCNGDSGGPLVVDGKLVVAQIAHAYIAISPRYNNGRIVGGTDAKADQAPFQVSIVLYTGWFDYLHICGGSLAGRRSVVTAAHCCDGYHASDLEARYDGLDFVTLKTINKVTKIDIHEGFNSQTHDWDYCVLTLRDDVVKSPTVQTIELATSVPLTGSAAHLTGWGRIPVTSAKALLQYTPMVIVSRQQCNEIWEPACQTVTERMICASNPSAGGCSGDVGNPLVADGRLVGILSWYGKDCPANTVEWPNLYSDVANQWQWLDDRIAK